ncbi:hypothetical protein LZ198_10280 [Myxococcus sp. K15C18031901]|uniref:hypothetical protein n=1 Tax=Myxococcus dinghuensis TaxID=2906761 RepID=UPI0020A6EED7|nr:hypothetical protein [Myxococcus dinghuensis]MCP3099257.1 hypothetical protein [Myxococcus dinghuensis]
MPTEDLTNRIVPYVVPSTYPRVPELSRELGHGLWVLLSKNLDGLVSGLSQEDLEDAGAMSIDEAWKTADENLDAYFKKEGTARRYSDEPGLPPFIVLSGTWLVATCIVLQRLHTIAARALPDTELLVSIPHRESLLIFPKGTAKSRAKMRARIRQVDGGGDKPLTFELFDLTATGVTPFHEAGA